MDSGPKTSISLEAFHTKHLTHYPNGMIPAIAYRNRLAATRLPKGVGVELGPLFWPLPMTADHKVLWADFKTKDENEPFYADKAPERAYSIGIVDPDIIVSNCDFSQLGLPELDFFVANHVLEHLPHPQFFMHQVCDLLKLGGVAMMALPDADKIFDKARNRTNVADVFGMDRTSKIAEHVIFVEGIRELDKIAARIVEIIETKDDPHLWVFDLATGPKFFSDLLEILALPLEITSMEYNDEFEEMIFFFTKVAK